MWIIESRAPSLVGNAKPPTRSFLLPRLTTTHPDRSTIGDHEFPCCSAVPSLVKQRAAQKEPVL